MGKPWHPYEQNFINHPKFLVLSAGAICLWLEGKNYADMHLTDGMIPRDAMRTFRFNTRGRVEELLQLVDGYSGSLWEVILIDGRDSQIGFRMHDYLNHNPCRDSVLTRIGRSDEDRKRKKANQKAWRDKKRDSNVTGNARDNGDISVEPTRPVEQKQKQLHKEQEQKKSGGGGRKERPMFQNQRFAVHRWQVEELISMLGAQVESFDLDEWLMTGAAKRASEEVAIIPNWWDWLKAETLIEAQRRGLPFATPRAGKAEQRSNVPNADRTAEYLRQQREAS